MEKEKFLDYGFAFNTAILTLASAPKIYNPPSFIDCSSCVNWDPDCLIDDPYDSDFAIVDCKNYKKKEVLNYEKETEKTN